MTLTRKGEATRQRIVEGAAEVIRERGVLATTLDDVRAQTGTSKSQLFHYFPDGKEALLLAVARWEADRVLEVQQPSLGALRTWDDFRTWQQVVLRHYTEQGRHCPLNVVMSQIGRNTPGAQAVVTQLMQRWLGELTAGIENLRAAGEIRPGLDPKQAASALLAGVQGGVLMLLTTGEPQHLEAALEVGIAGLRAA
ncbi:TetR/AcrR family transcriptional regulator [Amycolatopsis rubida]|uniref:TetR/AcrR family transcriptional regulator n=1 Tax=Amycolatopsis rubida TaxID=112413 RepID=A0ABX0C3U0_9PSEU|nr:MULTISPECIES: TetR/AcrR family transcriptional regulator [Amycolatopsis]MYW96974.1 TetR family transcriptional regulator [Amycolatopsis rubida]NEC61959.1 TetR/AcrR family transcriptional regulator [Amycolatopsis rubida]OAP21504.1 putative HTH-type transcriptional regulator YxaF [Amycolatopsis sp. M39]